jgi:hypothetical protein
MKMNERTFRVSVEKDIEVHPDQDPEQGTGSRVLFRVHVDHEQGVAPAFYAELIHEDGEVGASLNGLIPVMDLDAAKVADAILRAQTEIMRRRSQWEREAEERARVRAFSLPPVIRA